MTAEQKVIKAKVDYRIVFLETMPSPSREIATLPTALLQLRETQLLRGRDG